MVSRNRTSLICINLCIYSHLETYKVLVKKKIGEKIIKIMDYIFWNDLKWLLTIFTNSWSCSIILNRTRNLFLLLLPTVSAKQVSLPGQLLLSWTGPVQISFLSVKSYSHPLILHLKEISQTFLFNKGCYWIIVEVILTWSCTSNAIISNSSLISSSFLSPPPASRRPSSSSNVPAHSAIEGSLW